MWCGIPSPTRSPGLGTDFTWLRGLVQLPFVGLVCRATLSCNTRSTFVGLLRSRSGSGFWYRKAQLRIASGAEHTRNPAFLLVSRMFAVACVAGLLRAVLVIGVPARLRQRRSFHADLRRYRAGAGVLAASALLCAGLDSSDLDPELDVACLWSASS